jgi:hypothetical protein
VCGGGGGGGGDSNTLSIHKKCQSRIYLLQKLKKLGVNSRILQTFYTSFIESVLTFSFICWYGSLCVRSKGVLDRVVNVCGKIVGVQQQSLSVLYERRVTRKASNICTDRSHVLAHHFELLRGDGSAFLKLALSEERTLLFLKLFHFLTTCLKQCMKLIARVLF